MLRYLKYCNDCYSESELDKMREIETEIQKKQKTIEFYETIFKNMNVESVVKEWLFDGFETYSDYEKYGEMFMKVKDNK